LDDPPLLGRSALQLIENQFAMLLEYGQRPFERMEHRLSDLLSPHLAHARRRRARERCRPSFRQCAGWLGQDDCESSNRKVARRASGHRTRAASHAFSQSVTTRPTTTSLHSPDKREAEARLSYCMPFWRQSRQCCQKSTAAIAAGKNFWP